eukprot:scaffold1.g5501.t1
MAEVAEVDFRTNQEAFLRMAKYPLVANTHCNLLPAGLSPDMKQEAVDMCITACEKFPAAADVEKCTQSIKEQLDKKFGPAWQVVVGKSFSFEITHECKHMLYLFVVIDFASMLRNAANSAFPAGTGAGPSEWQQQWLHFLLRLHRGGHFSADPGVNADRLADADSGAVKRAVLAFARARPHLLNQLPQAPIAQLLAGGPPSRERKIANAWRRLDAAIVQQQPQVKGDVAPEFQDVMRVLLVVAEQRESAAAGAAAEVLAEVEQLLDHGPPADSDAPGDLLVDACLSLARWRGSRRRPCARLLPTRALHATRSQ